MTPCPYQKMYYSYLIQRLMGKIQYPELDNEQNGGNPNGERIFTLEELSQYDGSGGRPAYVAVNGIVYDVSLEPTWGGGTHFSLYAGRDLSNAFNGCHGRIEVLRNLPKVGILES